MRDIYIQGDEKGKCFICRKMGYTELHHVFGGNPNRDKSDHYGLYVHLCKEHHTGTYGVHSAKGVKFKDYLHQVGQEAFEQKYDRETFIANFGKNYL